MASFQKKWNYLLLKSLGFLYCFGDSSVLFATNFIEIYNILTTHDFDEPLWVHLKRWIDHCFHGKYIPSFKQVVNCPCVIVLVNFSIFLLSVLHGKMKLIIFYMAPSLWCLYFSSGNKKRSKSILPKEETNCIEHCWIRCLLHNSSSCLWSILSWWKALCECYF